MRRKVLSDHVGEIVGIGAVKRGSKGRRVASLSPPRTEDEFPSETVLHHAYGDRSLDFEVGSAVALPTNLRVTNQSLNTGVTPQTVSVLLEWDAAEGYDGSYYLTVREV